MKKRLRTCIFNNVIIWTFTLAIILFTNACDMEEREWEKALNSDSIEKYEHYLAKYPEGKHAAEADTILIELRDWKAASSANTLDVLKNYLTKYPGGRYNQAANDQLDSLFAQLEKKAFEEANKINTYKSYMGFIKNFPDGFYADSAKNLRNKLLLTEFRPDMLLFIGHPGVDPSNGIWRGKLKFSLGKDGVFTGMIYFITPDPEEENVAVIVNDNQGLPAGIEKGKIYIWLGEEQFILWKTFDVMKGDNEQLKAARDKIAKQLGLGKSGETLEEIPFYHPN